MAQNDAQKGCGPQPFEEPLSHGTPLARLTDLAAVACDAITACEKSATPHYWRLGQILSLARKQVSRGEWAVYLLTLGIEKTRASKARAIFRAFHSAEETTELSVGDAYNRRARSPSVKKSPRQSPQQSPPPTVTLPHWVYGLTEDAARLNDEVQFLSPSECARLDAAISQAVDLLADLQAALRRRDPNRLSADPSYVVADDSDFRVHHPA